MQINKFTQKSIEAINNCEKIALEYGNQELEQEHLLYALLTQEDGLIPKLIEKMEIRESEFVKRVVQGLEKRVKVAGGQMHMGPDLNKVLITALLRLQPEVLFRR